LSCKVSASSTRYAGTCPLHNSEAYSMIGRTKACHSVIAVRGRMPRSWRQIQRRSFDLLYAFLSASLTCIDQSEAFLLVTVPR
jgi:hypothetical protein